MKRKQPGPVNREASLPEDVKKRLRELELKRLQLEMEVEELKRGQELAERSRSRYSELYDSAPAGLVSMDLHGRIVDMNLKASEMLGYPRESLKGYILPFIKGASRDVFLRHLRETWQRSGRAQCELLMKKRNGDLFFVLMDSVRGEDLGRPMIHSTIIDISGRKEVEEERLKVAATAIEFAVESIVIWGWDGLVREVNESFCLTSGYTREEVVGRPALAMRGTEEGRARYVEAIETVKAGRQWKGRLTNRRKDGSPYEVEAVISPVVGAYGRLLNWVEVHHDITDRMDLEEQLRQAQKLESIGTLAGGIAHDFNNILAAIIGNAEMALDDTPADSPVHRMAGQIFKAAVRGRDLVKQILAFSRKTQQERRPFRLSGAVRESANLLKAAIPANVIIEVHADTESDTIFADAAQVGQVVMNLCVNAAQAMAPGGGKIEVTISGCENNACRYPADLDAARGGGFVRLTVADNGPGMGPETAARVFEPFFTTKKPGQGTGMGLAVAYGIVKAHGGAISVESEPGQGARFTVFLPVVAAGRAEEEASSAVPAGRGRVLFVDDEELLVEMTAQMLRRLGYKVTATESPLEALKLFSGDPDRYDLVITDYAMGEMTGMALSEQVLRLRPLVPVVLCTGYSDGVNPEIAEAAGIRALLMKPVTRPELAQVLARTLDPEGARGGALIRV